MLSVEELLELEERILELLPEKITGILTKANVTGKLDELLQLLEMPDMYLPSNGFDTYKNGKIVVVGGSEIKEETLRGIGKQLGIEKDRFEFFLDYKSVQKFDFRKMQYAPQYRVILFGPTPHSGYGKGDSSSIITEIEASDAYPRVERLISGRELKITKSNFRDMLQKLINEKYISV